MIGLRGSAAQASSADVRSPAEPLRTLAPQSGARVVALSDDVWKLLVTFGSSVPKVDVARSLKRTLSKQGSASTQVIDSLNTATIAHVTEGLQCPASRLATIAPLLSGATDPQKRKILDELGLAGVPVAQAMSAIDDIVKQSAVHTAVWVRPDFTVDADFKKAVDARLGTEVQTVEVNDIKGAVDGWSFGWTHGRLVNLVPENALEKNQVVTTSAVPNDPLWATAFDRANTVAEYPFDPADGRDPIAQRMLVGVVDCVATATENYRAAGLPMNNGTTLVAVVPAIGVPVSDITQQLAEPGALQRFLATLEPTRGTVYFPKTRMVGTQDVTSSLGPASRGPYEAVGSSPVKLSAALAASSIKFDETGISHAGGGSAHFALAPDKSDPEIIECARPFLFMLRSDATGLIIAAGIYRGPDKDQAEL